MWGRRVSKEEGGGGGGVSEVQPKKYTMVITNQGKVSGKSQITLQCHYDVSALCPIIIIIEIGIHICTCLDL